MLAVQIDMYAESERLKMGVGALVTILNSAATLGFQEEQNINFFH